MLSNDFGWENLSNFFFGYAEHDQVLFWNQPNNFRKN